MSHGTLAAGARNGAVSGYFRYHGFWAPGVRLFRNLRFRSKAALISLVLLLPVLVLGSAFLGDTGEQIAFSKKERDGVAAMQKLVPVLQHVLEVRNATRATLGGFDASKDYADGRKKVDAALAAFDEHLKRTADPLQLRERFEATRSAWTATASSKNGADEQGRTVFGPVSKALLSVLQGVTDESNLVLDPELDTLYTIMALFVNMPKAGEDLGQLWGWGTFGVASGGLANTEQYQRYAVWQARAEAGIEDALGAFERAFAARPELKTAIHLDGLSQARKFAKSADVTGMVKAAKEPAEVYAEGRAVLNGYFKVYDSALPALDALIAQRVESLQVRRDSRIAITLGAVLLAAYLFAAFAKVMDGGLKEVAMHLHRMADGDLTQQLHPWGKDEAADLMNALARSQTSMRELVGNVRAISETIQVASSEIAAGAMDLSSRTELAASQLQESAASLEQINGALGSTVANTQRASALAEDNAQTAQRSGEVIAQAVKTMGEIDKASTRIGDIVTTIDSIAFQTNILALNAAVEAARAGEQGRGFAVVASEVRALSMRSAAAAREIKTLVTDTVTKVQNGADVVRSAGKQMDALVGSAGSISGLVSEISTAAAQQTAGVRSVGGSVAGLDEMTQQNSALVEQTAAAAASLRQRADELVKAVSLFRTDATRGASAAPTAG